MSRAIAVFHGQFGRAAVYRLNRPFNIHAHREGHLIFHIGGADGHIDVDGRRCSGCGDTAVAVSPWEPHNFIPHDFDDGSLFLVIYVNPEWFAPDGGSARLCFGNPQITRSALLDRQIRQAAATICAGHGVCDLNNELRCLIEACFDLSWRQIEGRVIRRAIEGVTDFRVRKSIRLIEEGSGADVELDAVARESGLSRPHFYKLFRTQTGLTPNLFLNTILMERALDRLVRSVAPVAEIGYDLGFSSQSGFTKFFSANVGMAPSDYRRVALVL